MWRKKAFAEQRLARTASAAGTAFGWTDPEEEAALRAGERLERLRRTLAGLPVLFAGTVLAGLAYLVL